jgi:hypothetical protein
MRNSRDLSDKKAYQHVTSHVSMTMLSNTLSPFGRLMIVWRRRPLFIITVNEQLSQIRGSR